MAISAVFQKIRTSTMTKVLLCALSAALILTGCSDSKKADIERNDVPTPEPAPATPESKEEPKPVETTSTTPDKPAEKSTAPSAATPKMPEKPVKVAVSGTVWSTDRISVTTDDGIFSVPAGRQLRVVKHTEIGYIVTDEKTQFEVTEAQVSISSAAATNVLRAEAAERSAGAERHKAQLTAVQQQKEQAAVAHQAAEKDRKRRELQTKLEALTREEAALRASIAQAEQQESRYYHARAYGRTYTRSITPAQQTAWNVKLPLVQLEKNRILDELARPQQ
jgi:hypothetical protein